MIIIAGILDSHNTDNMRYLLIDKDGERSISDGQTRRTTYANSNVKYEVLKSDNTYEECTKHVYDYINERI